MKSLQEYQREFANLALKKFPNNSQWSEQDRLLAILRQLADVSGAIQKEKNLLITDNHSHENPNHRIACLMADIFILCEERKIDLEKELDRALEWYKN